MSSKFSIFDRILKNFVIKNSFVLNNISLLIKGCHKLLRIIPPYYLFLIPSINCRLISIQPWNSKFE